MRERHDTVVIGGGQAGLAMSAVLQRHGREHVVLERAQVGGRWRTERWESLRFQFPNWSLELPGYAYSGRDPNGFAHWREILRVIEDYAVSMRAPVHEHTDVTELVADDGGFAVSVSGTTIRANRVVVATGPFQRPRIPEFTRDVSPTVLQTDPTRYRRPEDLSPCCGALRLRRIPSCMRPSFGAKLTGRSQGRFPSRARCLWRSLKGTTSCCPSLRGHRFGRYWMSVGISKWIQQNELST